MPTHRKAFRQDCHQACRTMQGYFFSLVLLFTMLGFTQPLRAEADSTKAKQLLVIGDSLSAGYGIALDAGWVNLLQQRLDERATVLGSHWQVQNASVSGDTTDGGLRRLPALLAQHEPAVVIIELGGNDGLRGQSPKSMQNNLVQMIDQAKAQGAAVLLIQVPLPMNYGPRYAAAFKQAYEQAAAEGASLTGFVPEGGSIAPELMQDDGIHPNAQAQPLMLDAVWPSLLPLLKEAALLNQASK